jgi:glycosyltransferase 2 family protein
MSILSSAGKTEPVDQLNGELEQPVSAATADLIPVSPAASGEQNGSNGDPVGLRSRIFKPHTILSFAVALFILVFFFRRLDINIGDVWAIIKNANVWLLALALIIFYSTFIIRAFRWRLMLSQAGITDANGFAVPDIPRFVDIFILSWFANCVIPAKLGDGYRSYLLKRDSGAPMSSGLGTILAERLVDLVVLFSTMIVMGIIAFHGNVPGEAERTLIGGVALVAIGIIAVTVLYFFRDHLEQLIPHRFRAQYVRLHDGIFSCLRRPGRFAAISVVIWMFDGTRMFLVAKALGADIGFSTAVFVALMASLVATLPFTPAGLGVVEAAVIVILTDVVHLSPSMAGSIALMDRVITYWSLIVIGLILYGRQMKRDVIQSKSRRIVDSAPAQ